jgi:hypothetical protein
MSVPHEYFSDKHEYVSDKHEYCLLGLFRAAGCVRIPSAVPTVLPALVPDPLTDQQ